MFKDIYNYSQQKTGTDVKFINLERNYWWLQSFYLIILDNRYLYNKIDYFMLI